MRQIIQSKPTERSLRQAAFQDAMGQAVQYGSNVFDTAQRAKTMREQALQREQAQNMQDIMNAQKLQVQTGQEVSPEDFAMARQSGSLTQPTGMSGLGQAFGVQADMAAQERARDERARQQEEELRAAKLAQMGQPFEQSREAQKMRYAQSLKSGGSGKGERLTSQQVMKVQEGQDIPKMLQDVEQVLQSSQDIMGPIEGNLRSINPYDTRAKTFESQTKAASQAFGRFMEGGVLRKEDEEKYKRMFPDIGDTPEVAQAKLQTVQRLLAQKQAGQVEALSRAGYDVSPFNDLPIPQMAGVQGQGADLMNMNQSQMQQYDPTRPITEAIVPTANAAGGNPLSGAPTDALAQRRQLLLQKAGGQ